LKLKSRLRQVLLKNAILIFSLIAMSPLRTSRTPAPRPAS
jgi:hypothetical protein